MEFIDPLKQLGFTVHEIDGSHIGLATGRLRDRVREHRLIHAPQPLVDQAIEGGVTKVIAETRHGTAAGRSSTSAASPPSP